MSQRHVEMFGGPKDGEIIAVQHDQTEFTYRMFVGFDGQGNPIAGDVVYQQVSADDPLWRLRKESNA